MKHEDHGFVTLHRQIRKHPYWDDPERLRAWIDILFMAAWKDHRRMIGVKQVEIKRGEFIASERFLENRWGWSRGRVRRFLRFSQDVNEIRALNDTSHGTRYLVVKYDTYQNQRPTDDTTNSTSNGPPTVPATDQREQRTTKNNLVKQITDGFESFWSAYPKRAGGNPKATARKRWASALKRDESGNIIEGVMRYAAFCDATEKTGTEFVMQAATFLGQREGWTESWDVGEAKKSGVQARYDSLGETFDRLGIK